MLYAWRAPKVGLGGRFAVVSRESMLLANNVLLLVAAGTVLLGTLYPLLIDALGLGKLSVGPPYFNAVFVPLMVPAVFLMGIGPIARWKEARLPELAVRLRWAFGAGIAAALILPAVLGNWTPLIALGFLLAFWVIAAVIVSVAFGAHQAAGQGVWRRLTKHSRSTWGMHLAHLGIAVFILGITIVGGFESETDVKMEPGTTTTVAGYTFRFDGVEERPGPNYRAARGTVTVLEGGRVVEVMHPEKRLYDASGMAMTEAAIDTGITGDLYVSLGEPVGTNAWIVRVYSKPFVTWIWGGCILMALGGLLAITDRRYRFATKALPVVRPAAPEPADRILLPGAPRS
jgi:cytochrome c-type biogenesis protein CcmF